MDRAERAALVAARHEQMSVDGLPSLSELHDGIARMHRRMEQVHRVAARMHTSFADRLHAWHEAPERKQARPAFIDAVADAVGTTSAAVTLLNTEQVEAVVTTSDRTAEAAQDAEFVLGEGPTREVAALHRSVAATGTELVHRWPQYGTAVAGLGVTGVVAVPLRRRHTYLGALTVFDPPGTDPSGDLATFQATADALTRTVLLDVTSAGEHGLADSPLFEGVDDRRVLHRAAGIVSVQNDCDLVAALALIRARAFVDDVASTRIARGVVTGDLLLTAP